MRRRPGAGPGRRLKRTWAITMMVGLVASAGPGVSSAAAQDDATCAACHTNPTFFEGQPNPGRLVVRPEMVARSVHGAAGFGCTTCHGAMGFPHPEERDRVQCGGCHAEGELHAESLHGQAAARGDPLAPSCATCHGIHAVKSHTDPAARTAVMNVPTLCGECHHEGTPVSIQRDIPQDRILENYSLSMHGEGLFRQGLTVTAVCTSCHTSHHILPHTDPRSSIHRDNVAATCTQCHTLIEQVHLQVIEGRLWEENPDVIPACVDCHAPHVIRRVFYDAGAANQDCLRCHSDPDLVGVANGDTVSLYMDEAAYTGGVHGETACAQCHDDVTPGLGPGIRACTTAIASSVDCGVCHPDEIDDYTTGMHGQLAAQNDLDAPVCLDCHDKHATLSHESPASPTYPRNVPDLCARCHRPGEAAAVRIGDDVLNPVESYEMSIHGTGLIESGLVVTATCSNCHTPHRELPASDSLSSVHADNVAGTCGTCHHGIEEEFDTSVHATRREEGDSDRELPTCEDCHTSHTISRTDQDDFRLSMMNQCGRCHTEESETFFDTFHGKVSRLGEAGAAKCYDCHGTHNILPPTEAASMLSRGNIIETCSQCHQGVNRRFTGYLTHATHHDPERYPFLFWTFWAMTSLLVGTLTFAILHTLAWLWRLSRSPGKWKVHHTVAPGEKVFQRFTIFQRTLHIVMLLSFFTLALTGMALKFSHMGWAQVFADVLGGFAVTGVLHRLGAIALIVVFAVHVRDLRRQKRRRDKTWWQFLTDPNSLVFNRNDWRELCGSIKWFLGRGERPRYGRYTYWEKFDYFAVFWGMVVIGSTGIFLWFPEFFTNVLPGWTVNVATIIHSDEALLAVGFIFTVHFFNTHFRLDKFPMDPVIFTGHVPIEELKRDKPREYKELVESGKLSRKLVDPYPWKLERVFRIFGMTALAVGVTLILLILYSMLFGYQ